MARSRAFDVLVEPKILLTAIFGAKPGEYFDQRPGVKHRAPWVLPQSINKKQTREGSAAVLGSVVYQEHTPS